MGSRQRYENREFYKGLGLEKILAFKKRTKLEILVWGFSALCGCAGAVNN